MKIIKKYFFISLVITQSLSASNVNVVNSTSGQISITIQTSSKSVTQAITPNENQTLYELQNTVSEPTTISFDTSPIEKITITRTSTNMPQSIYYDNQDLNSSSGIGNLSRTGTGTMIITIDSTTINNTVYNLTDLSSFITLCERLTNNLSNTNIDQTQQKIDDLSKSLGVITASDMATQLETQTSVIKSNIDTLSNTIKIMKTLNDDIRIIQNDINNLSDQTLEQAQKDLQTIQANMQTVSQTTLPAAAQDQKKVLDNSITQLENNIQQITSKQQMTNYEVLAPEENLPIVLE